VIQKKSRIRRQLVVLGSTFASTTELVKGIWRSESGRRWLVPLAIFLCVTGAVLVLATSVEVLAPFIYTLF
jgi:hypothetical protein